MRKLKKKQNRLSVSYIKLWIFIIIVAGVLITFGLLSPVGQNVLNHARTLIHQMQVKARLNLNEVIVEGRVHTTLETINKQLNFTQGMPIRLVDLKEVRNTLLTLPWIKNVTVERYLPETIRILVEEKTPIAVWQNKKQYWPLDEEGHLIADEKTVLSGLILVVGADAPEKTPDLIQTLNKYPGIMERVRSAVRVGNRRWNLILDDIDKGLIVYLPDVNIDAALSRLEKLDQEEGLLDKDLKIIDLRLEDRLIVRTNAQELKRQKRIR